MALIIGFEFQIEEGDTSRWVRIMGNGGLMGNGMLAAANASGLRSSSVLSLLKRAQRNFRADGHIRILRSWDLPPAERFEDVTPDYIRAVRPIWDIQTPLPEPLSEPLSELAKGDVTNASQGDTHE